MVGVLASSAVDHGFEPWSVSNHIEYKKKLVFAASLLKKQHYGVRAKTGWLRIRIMCQSGPTLSIGELLFQ